ncbi:trypsin-like serine protease [Planosporangium thailandense]|uniref:Trypsin-like serine protease n=1 Tax=Planosporangium thailandense TaxID=765197 RepID=A0ABX0XY69_9ACTN|nr:trypsin-like serine protease [Planosporangium thailandense]
MPRTRTRVGWAAGLLTSTLAIGLTAATPAHAVAGPAPAPADAYGFVAKIDAGGRGCTGALINAWWVVTAASCFTEPGQTLPAGPPTKPATVTVGRPDLTTTAGHVLAVTTLVPRDGRNLVLAKLASAVTDVAPVALATTPATTGQTVTVAGYGRTATEWVPDTQHTAQFTVQGSTATTFDLVGATPDAAICKGDAGGPALRDAGGRPELVGLNHTSWQHGCYAETETRQGATETRTDDITAWITQNARVPVLRDFDGDGKTDIAAYYRYDNGLTRLFLFQGLDAASVTPKIAWDSGTGNWEMTRTKPVAGDFNGDGKTDIAAYYDYGNGRTALWLFQGVGTPSVSTKMVWDSGPGNWYWDRITPVTGDFDGDGKTDIAAYYRYDNGLTRLFLFQGLDAPSVTPKIAWDSGTGNWEMTRTKPVAGDFNGDGKTDIAAYYDYGNGRTALWLFQGVGTPSVTTKMVWDSGPGNWYWDRITPVTGDFDGDGKTDIAAYYRYDNGLTRLFLFQGLDAPSVTPKIAWDSGTGNWEMTRTKPVAGDFNGDGKTDIAAYYDYGNGRTALWLFQGVGTPSVTTKMVWDSGPGNWYWDRITPVS